MERRGTFDYILLETTGLADPGNIAPLFWVDDGLGSSIYLDGIVTLVDAKNILHMLEEPAPEEVQESRGDAPLTLAHLQISHADVIILNKSDLVTPAELETVKQRIVSINSLATIHVTDHSKISQIEGTVLDLHAYDKLATVDFHEKGQSKLDPVSQVVAWRDGIPLTYIAHLHPLLYCPGYPRRQGTVGGCVAALGAMGTPVALKQRRKSRLRNPQSQGSDPVGKFRDKDRPGCTRGIRDYRCGDQDTSISRSKL